MRKLGTRYKATWGVASGQELKSQPRIFYGVVKMPNGNTGLEMISRGDVKFGWEVFIYHIEYVKFRDTIHGYL